MKRLVCVLLCLMMVMTAVVASAADFYGSEPEKLFRQFLRGSGVKGTLQLDVSGSADWARLLNQMSGVELQLRALDSSQGLQYRLYVSDADEMVAMTEIVGDAEKAYLTSDFLMGKVYSFPAADGLTSALLDLGQENTNWYTLALNIFMVQSDTMEDKWLPQLESVLTAIDAWLSPYLSTETISRNGETLVLSHYEIPVDSFKAELKAILPAMLNNSELMALVDNQASDAQQALYLEPAYVTYYEQVVDQLPLEGNIVLEQTLTLKGESCGLLLSFPVADTKGGLKEITYSTEDGETSLMLVYQDHSIVVEADESEQGMTTGAFRIIRNEGQSISIAFTMVSSVTTETDEKSRNHETYDWRFELEPDLTHLDLLDPSRANYLDFEPATLTVNAHFYSKNGDTNAVTLNLTAALVTGDNEAQLTATLKSASPWQLPEMPESEAMVDLNAMTDDQRAELLNDWFNNGLAALSLLKPAEEAVATATDIASEEAPAEVAEAAE